MHDAESRLDTHDVAIPLLHATDTLGLDCGVKRCMRFLLLSPTCASDKDITATLSRIHHFASLTGGIDVALILILELPLGTTSQQPSVEAQASNAAGVHAYAKLQAELLALVDMPSIPVLPLLTVSGLPELLRTYTQQRNGPKKDQTVIRPMLSSIDLLKQCTTDPPLPSLAVNLATDTFRSLAHLSAESNRIKAVGSESVELGQPWASSNESDHSEAEGGFAVLREQLGEGVVMSMVDYWAEEWAAD